MSKLSNIVVGTAKTLGMAQGAFLKAREQMLRKPDFIASLSQSSSWNGGNLGNQEQAQMRAARNTWFYTGVNKKAMDLGMSKLDVYFNPSGLEEDGKKAEGHPFLKILRRPNPYMGKSLLFQYTSWWMDLQGEAFWFIEPGMNNGVSGIKGIYPLPSNAMDIEFTDDGKSIKRYVLKLDRWYYIDPNYVVHFRYANPWDIFRGLPPLIGFMLTIDADLAMKMWNGAFFGKDNVMPSAVISLGSGDPVNMFEQKDIDAVTSELKNNYSAIRRKTVVTNANTMSVALLGYNAKDMDFLAGMAWNKDEILLALGIPPGMLDKNSTEANAKVGDKVFKDSMWGIKSIIADEITVQCLQPFYSEDLEARFEDDRPTDREAELREAEIASNYLTEEEIREKYWQMPPLSNGQLSAKRQTQQERGNVNLEQERLRSERWPGNRNKVANPNNAIEKLETKSITDDINDDVVNKSIEDDFTALFNKAKNYFKQGKIEKLSFESKYIPVDTLKFIISDLRGIEQKSDIDYLKDHWGEQIMKTFTWRPWSGFEQSLIDIVLSALEKLYPHYLANINADMDKDDSIWNEAAELFKNEMMPTLVEIAKRATDDTIKELRKLQPAVSISYQLTNENALNYAYLYEALNIKTDRKAVSDAITAWKNDGEPNGLAGLRERIEGIKLANGLPMVSKERAELIAQSEATSVYAGAKAYALEANGYPKLAFQPKAHNRCRCYIQPGMKDGEKVVIWYTARDEMVCQRDIETPWGVVKGCRELHRTIVSENRAGEKWQGNTWNPETLENENE